MWRTSTTAVLAGLMVMGCHREAEAPAETAAVVVGVSPVVRGEVRAALSVRGTLEALPGRDAKLGALIAGRLAELRVAEGDHVEKGALLAVVDPTPSRDALTQAEANLSQARAQAQNAAARLERSRKALEAGVVAGQEVDDARAQDAAAQSALRSAEAAVSSAKNQVGRSEIRAPFAGIVAHLFAAVGEPVDGSGKPIVELVDPHALELHGLVRPADAAQLAPGATATVLIDGAPQPRQGQLIAVAPAVDPATGAVGVRVRLTNDDLRLRVGMAARAELEVAAHRGVLRIPRAALVPVDQDRTGAADGGGLAVELVGSDSTVKRRAVEVGLESGGFVEIVSGLAEGDRVVSQGSYALPDGAKVKTEDERPKDGGA